MSKKHDQNQIMQMKRLIFNKNGDSTIRGIRVLTLYLHIYESKLPGDFFQLHFTLFSYLRKLK